MGADFAQVERTKPPRAVIITMLVGAPIGAPTYIRSHSDSNRNCSCWGGSTNGSKGMPGL